MAAKSYSGVIRDYWLLSILMGAFFSWLLTFPMLGPSLVSIAVSRGVDPSGIGFGFVGFHALGLTIYGIWGSYSLARFTHRIDRLWAIARLVSCIDNLVMILSCLLCLGFTLAFIFTHHSAWLWMAYVLGLVSAPFIITVASITARTVPVDQRGRVFSSAMILANLVLYGHTALGPILRPSLCVLASVGCLFIPLIILLKRFSSIQDWYCIAVCREEWGNGEASLAGDIQSHEKSRSKGFPLYLAILIITFYTIGGLSYQVIFPSLASVHILDRYYNTLPYVLTSIISGQISDTTGRRPLAYMGFLALGTSLATFPLLGGPTGYFITQTLIQGGYACIDLFLWVTLADIAAEDRISWYYGVGLGLNVIAIHVGMFLTRFLLKNMPYMDLSRVSLAASIVLLLGVLGLAGLKETLWLPSASELPPSQTPKNLEDAIDQYVLDRLVMEYHLTPRELEITGLLLKGLSNREIERELSISTGTLKTHLRHIFQKTGTANRKELLLRFTHFLVSDSEHNN